MLKLQFYEIDSFEFECSCLLEFILADRFAWMKLVKLETCFISAYAFHLDAHSEVSGLVGGKFH